MDEPMTPAPRMVTVLMLNSLAGLNQCLSALAVEEVNLVERRNQADRGATRQLQAMDSLALVDELAA